MGERRSYSVTDARIPVLTDRLRQVIEKAGGVSAMSKLTGISKTTVNFWYNGQRTPDAVGLKAIAEGCGESVDWLLGTEGADVAGVKDVSAFLDKTGLTLAAFEQLEKIKGVSICSAMSDVLNLLIENDEFDLILMAIESAIRGKNSGNERRIEESLFAASWALRRMLPQIANNFKDRGYLTTEQRIELDMAKGGTDNGES